MNWIVGLNVIEVRMRPTVRSIEHTENIPQCDVAGIPRELVPAKGSARAPHEPCSI